MIVTEKKLKEIQVEIIKVLLLEYEISEASHEAVGEYFSIWPTRPGDGIYDLSKIDLNACAIFEVAAWRDEAERLFDLEIRGYSKLDRILYGRYITYNRKWLLELKYVFEEMWQAQGRNIPLAVLNKENVNGKT